MVGPFRQVEAAGMQPVPGQRRGSDQVMAACVVACPHGGPRAAERNNGNAASHRPPMRGQDADEAPCKAQMRPASDETQDSWRARLRQVLEVTRRYFAAPLAEFERRAVATDRAAADRRADDRTRRAVPSAGRRGDGPRRCGLPALPGMNRPWRSNA